MSAYGESYEGPEVIVLKDKLIRARKKHTCMTCDGPIIKNEEHRYIVLIVDGDFEVDRSHFGARRGMCIRECDPSVPAGAI